MDISAKIREFIAAMRWAAVMAWRDSRGRRRLLLLFTLSIVFGIGALVAISSFRHNLEHSIDLHARSLLGADLALKSRRPFSEEVEGFIASLGGDQAREVRFRSMAWFPEQGQTRLVQVRALEGDFPFYGQIETAPPGVDFRDGQQPLALVEDSLLVQYDVRPGDTVRLGEIHFTIAGGLLRVSGESDMVGVFAPRIYIDKRYLAETGLMQRGSVSRHRVYFAFEGGLDEERKIRLEEARRDLLAEERVRVDTVERRRRRVGRVLDNLYDFLNLVGFIALLLGGLGVAGAVQIYLREKLDTVALLRCLGSSMARAFAVYLIQVTAMGLVGAVTGAALGVAVQFLLPWVLGPFLPFQAEVFVSWSTVAVSVVFGWVTVVLFAFIPLLSIRRITPLRALRANVENPHALRRDPWFWAVTGLIAVLALGFCLAGASRPAYGFGFAGALAGSLLFLSGLAWALRWVLRRYCPKSWPYSWRQGLSNLYRPNNRTLFLTVTLGMGVFLVFTLFLARDLLLHEIEISGSGEQPNLVFFDIQPDQLEEVRELVAGEGYTVETVPVVTMRIAEINGRTIKEIKNDPSRKIGSWALNWEYRSTFRGELIETEELLEGRFTAKWNGEGAVPVSVEESIAESLQIKQGDELVFDVQGIPIKTRVSGIRKVDWHRLRPNFYMVFPLGVLEEAPAFYALVTRVPDRNALAALQRQVVQAHPNISAIDLSLALETINSILDRAAFVVRFMAAFTIATGLVVLAGAVITSRYQRVCESVLLRTLGASGNLIRRIMAVEYLLLGFLGGIAGLALSAAGGWALARFVFELDFVYSWGPAIMALLILMGLTLLIGLANSRGIASHPPLEILRQEG